MKFLFETTRLKIREFLPSDIDGMFELDSNPEVHKYLGNKPAKDELDAIQSIEEKITQYKEYGVGRWAVIVKKNNDFIGWAGLKYITETTNNHQNYYDLGYRFNQKHWGKGIATEAALAVIDYAFSMLEINKIYAMADCDNVASNKVLTKIGMSLIEEFYFEETRCNWYEIKRPNFPHNTVEV